MTPAGPLALIKLGKSKLGWLLAHASTTKLQVPLIDSLLKGDFMGAIKRVIFKCEPDLQV